MISDSMKFKIKLFRYIYKVYLFNLFVYKNLFYIINFSFCLYFKIYKIFIDIFISK